MTHAASIKTKSKTTRQALSEYGKVLGKLGNIKKAQLVKNAPK